MAERPAAAADTFNPRAKKSIENRLCYLVLNPLLSSLCRPITFVVETPESDEERSSIAHFIFHHNFRLNGLEEAEEWSDWAPFTFLGIAASLSISVSPPPPSLSPSRLAPSLVKSQRNALDSGVTVQSPTPPPSQCSGGHRFRLSPTLVPHLRVQAKSQA